MRENFVTCKITKPGNYMGIQAPAYNIRITYSTYTLMRQIGIPIEIYTPGVDDVVKEEPKKVETKKVEEVVAPKEEVNVIPLEEPTAELPGLEDVEDTDDEDKEIEKLIKDYDPEKDVKPVSKKKEKKIPDSDLTHPDRVYTDEMMNHLTKDDLKKILYRRGHTSMRDPNRGKQLDNREDLYKKVKNTQKN